MKCHSCNNQNLHVLVKLQDVVENVQYLPTDPDASVPKNQLEVMQCANCGLVQIDVALSKNYYDDYLMTTSFSQQLQDYLAHLARDFFTQHLWPGARVIDIGCGDGAFMQAFRELPVEIYGIEPSQKAALEAKNQGFDVQPGYVTADSVLAHAPYDAFVSRQVLEHVSDISGFLLGIRHNLAPGAVGIIEVPSLDKTIADGRWFDFFPDHVNYFDAQSLRLALELHGFDVLRQTRGMFDEYELAFVRVRDHVRLEYLGDWQHTLRNNIKQFLHRNKQHGRRVAFWGAGAKGIGMLATLDRSDVMTVIDSDPHKHHRYLPGSGIAVMAPEQTVHDCDVIVITALAYSNAIVDKLDSVYDYDGEIWVVDRKELIRIDRRA